MNQVALKLDRQTTIRVDLRDQSGSEYNQSFGLSYGQDTSSNVTGVQQGSIFYFVNVNCTDGQFFASFSNPMTELSVPTGITFTPGAFNFIKVQIFTHTLIVAQLLLPSGQAPASYGRF